MTCYHPQTAYLPVGGGRLTFRESSSSLRQVEIPCGKCIGCRLDYSRTWAVRAYHESQMHDASCFVTFTFSDEHLPRSQSLNRVFFTKFLKRLRRALDPVRIRYMACGEYGDANFRPHYHMIVFGTDFVSDRYYWRMSDRGDKFYRSPLLESVWTYGNSEIGDFSFKTAAYVARYITKKITGNLSDDHYQSCDSVTGAPVTLEREFLAVSRNPGLGSSWYAKFSDDLKHDYCVIDGIKFPLPKYYDRKLDAFDLDARKFARSQRAIKRLVDSTDERLAVRKQVLLSKLVQHRGN